MLVMHRERLQNTIRSENKNEIEKKKKKKICITQHQV